MLTQGAGPSPTPAKVLVLGAGAWGTALAIQAARAGNDTVLWARDPDRAAAMERTRLAPRLAERALPAGLRVISGVPEAADLVVLAVPTQFLRSIMPVVPDAPVVICAKGVETASGMFPLEILAAERPDLAGLVLTGPNFAHEVAAGLPAAAVVAGADAALRDRVARCLGTPAFRLYGNDDPIGAQIGGAAKNVIAIAAGAVIGAALGENARAALITRGLVELGRLVAAMGGRAETVMGLSGLGDLLLTCTGASSRNFSLGLALGRGDALSAILSRRDGVTEGVATAPALLARARREAPNVELPVCQAVADLLTGTTDLASVISSLLARPRRDEHDAGGV
jgi:glycerol-3-phosphate dehydrogenase (NAD(P)+)